MQRRRTLHRLIPFVDSSGPSWRTDRKQERRYIDQGNQQKHKHHEKVAASKHGWGRPSLGPAPS